ncbi:MAG: hypothetical protein WCP86_05790, partial [bacterium]
SARSTTNSGSSYDVTCAVIQVTCVDVTNLFLTNLCSGRSVTDTSRVDEVQSETNTMYLCESNGAAHMDMQAGWAPTNVAGNMIRWETVLTNGSPTAQWGVTNSVGTWSSTSNSTFATNPVTVIWTNKPDGSGNTNREFKVRAWYDNDGDGKYTNTEPHRELYATVVDTPWLILSNSVISNSVMDTTWRNEAPVASNVLFIAETTNGNGEMQMQLGWLPPNVNSNWFRWKIELTNGSPSTQWGLTNSAGFWSSVSNSTFATNPVSVLWTNMLDANGLTNREFMVTAWFDCNTNGLFETNEVHRQLFVSIIRGLVLDSNRDRVINDDDLHGGVFRFWINDDADSEEVNSRERADAPPPCWPSPWLVLLGPLAESSYGWSENYADNNVNGNRDLIDYFPAFVDIKEVLKFCDIATVKVCLKHADSSINVCFSELTATNAGFYLTDVSTANTLSNATVNQVTSTGVQFTTNFLMKIRDESKGVVLVEGRSNSTSPLVLEVRDGSSGTLLFRTCRALSVSSVTNMFRHVNLRGKIGGSISIPDQTNSPDNFPDEELVNKDFVFTHGFLTDETLAQAGYCEVFKRLFWSGFRARFHAVTWRGDECLIASLHFHKNLRNAYDTAPYFASYVNSLTGDVTVLAHSLGNQTVSSAIQDHGMKTSQYFMLGSAVGRECFDPSVSNYDTMVHCDWANYSSRLWASKWHELFPAGDHRTELAWADRFPLVLSNAYNFYSLGDQVLEVANATPSMLAPLTWSDKSRYAWWKQELLKGRLSAIEGGPLGGSTYGGWEFTESLDLTYRNLPFFSLYDVGEMAAISNAQLRTTPFFYSGKLGIWSPAGISDLYDSAAGATSIGSTYAQTNGDRLRAEMIPLLSSAAGVDEIPKLNTLTGTTRNFDMRPAFANGWPASRSTAGSMFQDRWLHRDHRDLAYVHVFKLYDKFVELGGLK